MITEKAAAPEITLLNGKHPLCSLSLMHTPIERRDDDSSWQLATHPGQTELEIVIENITFQLNVLVMAQRVPSTHTDATTYL